MVEKYLDEMYGAFGAETPFFVTVHLGLLLSPILESYGELLTKPLAFIVENQNETESIFKIFSVFGDGCCVSASGVRNVKKIVEADSGYPVFIMGRNDVQTEALLERVSEDILVRGDTFGQGTRPVIFVFQEILPPQFRKKCIQIPVKLTSNFRGVRNTETKFVDLFGTRIVQNMSAIDLVLKKKSDDCMDPFQSWLQTAFRIITIFYDDVFEPEKRREFARFWEYTKISNYATICLEAADNNSLIEIVREAIYKWRAESNFSNMKNRYERLGISDAEEAILVDDKYYYFPEPLFRRACGKLLTSYSMIQIKSALVEAEILDKNNIHSNFTVKLSVKMETGGERIRVMQIKRDFLDVVGELDFSTLCENGGE